MIWAYIIAGVVTSWSFYLMAQNDILKYQNKKLKERLAYLEENLANKKEK